MGLGQAAGTAAGISIMQKTPIQKLDHDELISELKKQGINGLAGEEL